MTSGATERDELRDALIHTLVFHKFLKTFLNQTEGQPVNVSWFLPF